MKWYYPSDGKQKAKAAFTRYFIGFKASNLIVINDSGTDDLEISFNGTNTHGHIIPGEPLNLGDIELTEMWFKGKADEEFRVWAYAK